MNKIFMALLSGFGMFLVMAWLISLLGNSEVRQATRNLNETWRGYRSYFIHADGKVLRLQEQDVISEAQANAMLRAVVMNDRRTFDRVRKWTQEHLSREKISRDHLLSWHYQNDAVKDTMPAADADIDYALALVLASRQWNNDAYAQMARQSLKDILDHLTVVLGYRRYLLPWMISSAGEQENLPQNLSYYSPAYFKLFNQFDHDSRWLELVDTGYVLMLQSQRNFSGAAGKGLMPDWCMVDRRGGLHPYEGHSANFSWEAVRIPFHVGIDAYFYRDPRAMEVLSGFARFVGGQINSRKRLVTEYSYDGKPLQQQESPLMYAAAYIALALTNDRTAETAMDRLRGHLHWGWRGAYYGNPKEYYLNSLAWAAEFLYREAIHDQK